MKSFKKDGWFCHPFFILCIFLLICTTSSRAEFALTPALDSAYKQILSLKLEAGNESLTLAKKLNPDNNFALLIENYSDVLSILISENESLYPEFRKKQDKRLQVIRSERKPSPWKRLIEAEIRFQGALVKLKFNDEISAAWELKQVYQLLKENKKLYPHFVSHKKLLGLFEIFIGSVPEKYEWLTAILGFKGNVSAGLTYLEQVENSNTFFSLEASMLKSAAQKYIVKRQDCVSCLLEGRLRANPENFLLTYLYASILVKEGLSDKAFAALSAFESSEKHIEFPLSDLLLGEILLYKGNYLQARQYFFSFLNNNEGKNHIKDACYKIFLSYWLTGEDEKAQLWLQKTIQHGQVVYDADKYAEKFAKSKRLPDKVLMKARLATDGGFLDQALKELSKYCIKAQANHADNIEFSYRKGRIFQLLGRTVEAKSNYIKTINLSEDKSFYFAPNACLQLGYIYRDEKEYAMAKKYFEKALQYKDHEYKNSIDNKARAALNELAKK